MMLFNVYVGVSKEEGIVVVQLKAKNHDQALEKVKRIFPKAEDYTLNAVGNGSLAEYYTEVLLW